MPWGFNVDSMMLRCRGAPGRVEHAADVDAYDGEQVDLDPELHRRLRNMARPAGLEPATPGLEDRFLPF
jgi:hypothetical protein